MSFIKYPRTPHLVGSRLQPGDSAAGQIPWEQLRGGRLIFEEKIDGANAAVSFDATGQLMLQSRGHVLMGGAREAQFALFKAWAQTHERVFFDLLGRRYVMFGEWCFAKHTVFYDRLPHYFHEFDIYDRERDVFLSTPCRHKMLAGLPVVSVPVVHEGPLPKGVSLKALIKHSLYKSEQWRQVLEEIAVEAGVGVDRVLRETEDSNLAEGLYLKHEDGDRVIGRYKFIRADFHQAILDSGSHWRARPIVPNQLAPGIDLFGGDAP
jgi:hypothetical protein